MIADTVLNIWKTDLAESYMRELVLVIHLARWCSLFALGVIMNRTICRILTDIDASVNLKKVGRQLSNRKLSLLDRLIILKKILISMMHTYPLNSMLSSLRYIYRPVVRFLS